MKGKQGGTEKGEESMECENKNLFHTLNNQNC